MAFRDDLRTAIYYEGAALDDLTITWRRANKTLIDFSSGYTFTVLLADHRTPDALAFAAKNNQAHFTGAATDPNLSVHWVAADLPTLTPGRYQGLIQAVRDADSKARKMPFEIHIRRVPGP